MFNGENVELSLLPHVKLQNAEEAATNGAALEEYLCQRGDVNICMLLNRRHRHLRILDYRIGNYQLKRAMLDQFAKRKRLRKVFTLVEKQDSNSWRTVGFSREAVVPAFFRTADAYVMSRAYDEAGEPLTGGLSKISSEYAVPQPRAVRKPTGIRMELIRDGGSILNTVLHDGATDFYSPFGRGLHGPDLGVRAKQTHGERWVVAEINDSFGHAKLDFLHPASSAKDLGLVVTAAETLLGALAEREVANVFGFSSVNDALTAEAFGAAGFRNTGQLTRHVTRENTDPEDVHVWHRRIQPRR
jgi:hypothetical protein